MRKFILFIALLFPALALSQDRDNIPSQTILNWAYNDDTGGFNADVQDQTTPSFDFYMGKATNQTTVAVATSVDDKTITVANTTGFVDGAYIFMLLEDGTEGFIHYFAFQIGAVAGNVVTVDSPLNYAFPVGSIVLVGSADMDVDGSVTPQVFSVFGPRAGSYDITRIMIKMLCPAAPTLGAFCSLTELTNGVVLRSKIDGYTRNLYNVKKNADWALMTYDYSPYTAIGAGQDGVFFRNTFAGKDKHGVVIRLDSEDDELQLVIQDNLTNLDEFRIIVQGHFVQD